MIRRSSEWHVVPEDGGHKVRLFADGNLVGVLLREDAVKLGNEMIYAAREMQTTPGPVFIDCKRCGDSHAVNNCRIDRIVETIRGGQDG